MSKSGEALCFAEVLLRNRFSMAQSGSKGSLGSSTATVAYPPSRSAVVKNQFDNKRVAKIPIDILTYKRAIEG